MLLYYTRYQSRKRGIIQSNACRILPNASQVLYTLDTIYIIRAKYHDPSSSGSPDILFTRRHRFTMRKSKVCYIVRLRNKIWARLIFMLQVVLYIEFQDPISNGS